MVSTGQHGMPMFICVYTSVRVCLHLRSSACVYQRSFASACVRMRATASACKHLRLSAYSRLNVQTQMDPCVWTHLSFKDFRDVLYLYLQNKDSCKYYTGYRELPGAPPACLRRDDTLGPPHTYVFLCVTFVVFIRPK